MWSNFQTNTCNKIPELGQKCLLDRPDSLPAVRSQKGTRLPKSVRPSVFELRPLFSSRDPVFMSNLDCNSAREISQTELLHLTLHVPSLVPRRIGHIIMIIKDRLGTRLTWIILGE